MRKVIELENLAAEAAPALDWDDDWEKYKWCQCEINFNFLGKFMYSLCIHFLGRYLCTIGTPQDYLRMHYSQENLTEKLLKW